MGSYNLFRLNDGADLCCAVPENRAVPGFVDGHRWSFGGKVEDKGSGPPGFDKRAAVTAVRFNGFYLFQSGDRPPRRDGA